MKKLTMTQFAAHLEVAASRLEGELVETERESIADAEREAHRHSNGPYSLAVLAATGHPYARRAPNPPADPAILNRQTGRLDNAWRTTGPQAAGDIVSQLVNDSPESVFMDGTVKMIRRPVIERIAGRIDRRRESRIWRTLFDVITGERI